MSIPRIETPPRN